MPSGLDRCNVAFFFFFLLLLKTKTLTSAPCNERRQPVLRQLQSMVLQDGFAGASTSGRDRGAWGQLVEGLGTCGRSLWSVPWSSILNLPTCSALAGIAVGCMGPIKGGPSSASTVRVVYGKVRVVYGKAMLCGVAGSFCFSSSICHAFGPESCCHADVLFRNGTLPLVSLGDSLDMLGNRQSHVST
jgi:hypothetical protein